jgi:tryptophan synthase alpha chain
LPFIPAGYPDLAATGALIQSLEQAGASAIEIGIPFSDPIADGPVIQEAFAHALANRVRVRDVLATVAAARKASDLPLIAMVSFSIVFRYGAVRFFADARGAGFDAVILPDLPPPEAAPICAEARSAALDTILLVSPTTTPQRRSEILRLCSGFVYYLSVTGITGERDALPPELAANVTSLRHEAQVPVCVGFGISKPEHLSQLAQLADGAIVGSALVRRIREHAGEGPAQIARVAAAYCRELLAAVR